MSSRLCLFVAIAFLAIKAHAKPAILLVEKGGREWVLKAIESLNDYEFISPKEVLFFQAHECVLDDVDAKATEISKAIDDASTLFYEDAALKPAEEKLRWALWEMSNRPCVGIGNKGFLKKAFSGAILLIRILLATNSPDAEEVASLVFSRFWYFPLTEVDIPPDVRDFLESYAKKETKKIRIVQKGDEELAVAVDRNVVGRGNEVLAYCPEGDHDFAFISPKGKVYTGKMRVTNDLQTIRVYEPFLKDPVYLQDNAVVLAEDRLEKAANDLWSFLEMPVVVVQSKDGREVVVEYSNTGEKKEILMSVRKESVSKKRNLRTCGYAVGGVAVGLLGVGIALNVMANQEVSHINSGQNRISQHSRYKWASIGCYVGAGASGVASLVLMLLKKDSVKPQAFDRGFAVSFEF